MLATVESAPNETLTEQNAHNISVMVFYDVQLQQAMTDLAMDVDEDLLLAVNRLKSLQKLYLFEQKGGEDYLGFLRRHKRLYKRNIQTQWKNRIHWRFTVVPHLSHKLDLTLPLPPCLLY
jgi:hypothetical protein